MELMEVPPAIWPTLRMVRRAGCGVEAGPGDARSGAERSRESRSRDSRASSARARMRMGLGVPASVQEWPPGPVTVSR